MKSGGGDGGGAGWGASGPNDIVGGLSERTRTRRGGTPSVWDRKRRGELLYELLECPRTLRNTLDEEIGVGED